MEYDPLQDNISKVELLDTLGTDLTVANAARVSFNKESKWDDEDFQLLKAEDDKLIKYLAKHNHWSPFGHVQFQFRVKAPIFVARQLVKHQVGLVWNEVSRRYVDSDIEFYLPNSVRLRPDNGIKQGSSDATTNEFDYPMATLAADCHALYIDMITSGVAPEEARMILPLNLYTEWIWTGSLMAFIRVAKLRMDEHSQSQTRAYGAAIYKLILSRCPTSVFAWMGNKHETN